MTIIRTKTKGCFEVQRNLLGTYLLKINDPDPQAVPDALSNQFVVSKNAPKIPGEIWGALVQLYFHYHRKNKEVCVIFLYNPTTKDWKAIVPEQEVTTASVNKSPHKGCNLLTGEHLSDYMNTSEGYEFMGDSHLHPFNLPDFSSTDDTNELSTPGLHILVSSINLVKNTYVITSSVVAGKKRYIIKEDELLIELNGKGATYHPNCLKYVKERVASLSHKKGSAVMKYEDYLKTGKSRDWSLLNYEDPFFDDSRYDFPITQKLDNREMLKECIEDFFYEGRSEEEILTLVRETITKMKEEDPTIKLWSGYYGI